MNAVSRSRLRASLESRPARQLALSAAVLLCLAVPAAGQIFWIPPELPIFYIPPELPCCLFPGPQCPGGPITPAVPEFYIPPELPIDGPWDQPIIPVTTKVLDPQTSVQFYIPPELPCLGAPSCTLYFRGTTPLLQSLRPGDVLVGGITPQTRQGLLRRVGAVYRYPWYTIVQTGPAKLADAITVGGFYGTFWLTTPPADTTAAASAPSAPVVLPVDVTQGGARLQGKVVLGSPESLQVGIGLTIENGQVRSLFHANVTGMEAKFVVSATQATSLQLMRTIGKVRLQPLQFWIGRVPVVVDPELRVDLQAYGQLGNNLNGLVLHESVGLQAWTSYPDCTTPTALRCGKIWAQPRASFAVRAPQVPSTAELAIGLGPRLDFKYYFLDGPYLQETVWSKQLLNQNSCWEQYGYLDATIGVQSRVLGHYWTTQPSSWAAPPTRGCGYTPN